MKQMLLVAFLSLLSLPWQVSCFSSLLVKAQVPNQNIKALYAHETVVDVGQETTLYSKLVDTNSRKDVATAFLLAMIGTVSASTVPLFFSKVLQILATPSFTLKQLLRPIMGMVICHIIEPIMTILYIRKCSTLIDNCITSLRATVFSKTLTTSISTFDSKGPSAATQVIVNDIDKIRSIALQNISRDRGARAGMELILGFLILFKLCFPLALMFVTVVPLTAFISSKFAKNFFKSSRDENIAAIQQQRYVDEVMMNFKEVFSFSNQRFQERKFVDVLKANSLAFLTTGRAKAVFEAANRAGIYTNIITLFSVGGYLVTKGYLAATVLTSFIGYCWTLNFATQGLLFSYGDWKMMSTSWDNIKGVLSSPVNSASKVKVATSDSSLTQWCASPHNSMSIELKNLMFSYPNRVDLSVLKNVNLRIPPGKVTALVGPSGAGKSTIASLLGLFYTASDGEITVDGLDIHRIPKDEYLKKVSIVRQTPYLFTDTLANNIAYGAISYRVVTMEEIIAAAKTANAHDFIMSLPEGYNTVIGSGSGCVQLSGGQQQRVSMARAILKDASLLILDESTSALDSESEALVQESLSRLMSNRTTVVIAHRLSTIINADQICVVREGKIAEVGVHKELMEKRGYYYSLMNTQMNNYQLMPSTEL
jgi:ABC-type multidrug transport system fused ATPase/permease subunit